MGLNSGEKMKTKTILTVLFLILAVQIVSAQTGIQLNNEKQKGEITYKLNHPAHEVNAKSNALNIKIEYDKNNNVILKAIAQVKVTTFDSGNSSRDSHAMEAIESGKFPQATFKSTGLKYSGNSIKIYGDLTFHGITKNITINASQNIEGDYLVIKGSFGTSLDEHKVERPKLLFVPTDEYLHFEFTSYFKIN